MSREHALCLVACAALALCSCSDHPPQAAPAQPSSTDDKPSTSPSAGTGSAGKAAGAGGQTSNAGTNSQPAKGGAMNAGTSPSNGAAAGTGGNAEAGAAAGGGGAAAKPPAKLPDGAVSKPGQYSGFGDKLYDAYKITSEYVPVRDGTKLAMDLYRPTDAGGKIVADPLPVLFMYTPYNRRYFPAGNTGDGTSGDSYPGVAARLVQYGYVVAIADFRGVYASYGTNKGYNRGEWVEDARFDSYDLIEWLAMQPWSTGNVGMWGCSATGGSQMQAITTAPPHLKAVFPMSCEWDVFPFGVPGGMSASAGDTKAPPGGGSAATRDATAVAVDGDAAGTQLRAATASHAGGIENPGYVPFRDSVAANIPVKWWEVSSPSTYIDAINKGAIPAYVAANWDEAATKYGAAFTFNNLKAPSKLIIGPTTHCAWAMVESMTGFQIYVEEHRWFDHWLKGIENGVTDEDRVYYWTYNEPKGEEWRSAPSWPLPNEKRVNYYLGDKTLATTAPTADSAKDEARVDYTATATKYSGGIAYDTEALAADVRVTGHPVAELWVASTHTDGDFIATLLDVAPNGTTTTYNMQGRLRASLRKEADAPYNNLGLPYHPMNMADAQPLTPNEPVLLRFDLYPISIVFKAGHKIRLMLTFADTVTPQVNPAPSVSIYRDAMHQSFVTLPIIEN